MLAEDFIQQKKTSWERLTALLDRSRLSGVAALSAEEIAELGALYRSATADLAVARRDYAGQRVTEYLNGLVGRAHATIYQAPAARGRAIRGFFTHGFPQAFRATWPYTLAAFLMFFVPAVAAFVTALRDPAAGAALVPGAEGIIQDIRDNREWWLAINDEGRAASASLIMTNNIRVAIVAFAGGMLLGLLTFYVLVQNGLLLGVVAGAAQAYGFAGNLWGFVAAHGVVELSVIFIAGGAGLQIGWSIVRPGLLTRRASLVLAARRAMVLLLGCALLLVLAGLIEAFISPSNLPPLVKYAVALGSGVLLYAYLLLAGRGASAEALRT
jgi:uncharacterized membrane protein SpoIIM required for sporulation